MHHTVGNFLHTLLYRKTLLNMTQASDIVDKALAQEIHALRMTIMTTFRNSPGSLAFSKDIFLNIP